MIIEFNAIHGYRKSQKNFVKIFLARYPGLFENYSMQKLITR